MYRKITLRELEVWGFIISGHDLNTRYTDGRLRKKLRELLNKIIKENKKKINKEVIKENNAWLEARAQHVNYIGSVVIDDAMCTTNPKEHMNSDRCFSETFFLQ